MPKLTDLEELQAAIRLAAVDSESSALKTAEEFYAQHRQLIAGVVADQWIIEKLSKLIRGHRSKVRRETDHQFVLEGMLGFKRVPRKIPYRGHFIPSSDATIKHFRKLAAKLRKEKSPALVDALSAITLLKKYTKRGGDPITWGEALELEAAKASR